MKPRSAIACAIELWRQPSLAPLMRRRPLPAGVLTLIKLAADVPEAREEARRETSLPADQLRRAAVLYLQQVVLHAGATPRRVLGGNEDAGLEQLRENRRWLLMWLHPDRNADRWESAFFNRVQRAWLDLSQAGERTAPRQLPAPRMRRRRRRSAHVPWVRIPLKPEKRRNAVARGPMAALLSLLAKFAAIPKKMQEKAWRQSRTY
jgi:hypothetical protein